MKAIMKNDDYIDISPCYEYEVTRVYRNGYIKLKGKPRFYQADSFEIRYKGEKIPFKKAYQIYKVQSVLSKLGINHRRGDKKAWK